MRFAGCCNKCTRSLRLPLSLALLRHLDLPVQHFVHLCWCRFFFCGPAAIQSSAFICPATCTCATCNVNFVPYISNFFHIFFQCSASFYFSIWATKKIIEKSFVQETKKKRILYVRKKKELQITMTTCTIKMVADTYNDKMEFFQWWQ